MGNFVEKREHENYIAAAAAAKDIYAGIAADLTKIEILGDTLPTDTSFDDIKHELSENGYFFLDTTSQNMDKMNVRLDFSQSDFGTYIDKVTVTLKNTTAEYPVP